ncbi:MAG TPA: hypothetical protein VGJ85_02295 [Candidatus Nanopelagicaceae bacterium]
MDSYSENAQGVSALARVRKRFLVISVTALALAGLSLGVSFTADTGVTQMTAASTGGALPLVWSASYGTPGGLPAAVDTATATAGWKYGTGTPSTPGLPVWPTVVAGQAGSVTSAGDVAVIDATDTTANYLLITIYITNMRALALTYNSYSLPIRVYSGTSVVNGVVTPNISWGGSPATDANSTNTGSTYLTNTQGFETFKFATGAGRYYAITLDAGGAFYPYQTTGGGDTTPAFYITAQRTS